MTDQQHPIAPPLVLLQQWWEQADQYQDDPKTYFDYVVTEVAQWAADQELEACCADLRTIYGIQMSKWLRSMRRPKPPSLKEQALEGLTRIESTNDFFSNQMKDLATIRRALEQLDD